MTHDFTFTKPRPATIGKYHPIVGEMTDVKGYATGNLRAGNQSVVARVFKYGIGEYMVFLPSNHDPIHIRSWDKAKVIPTIQRSVALQSKGIGDMSVWLRVEEAFAANHGHDGADCMCFEHEEDGTPQQERMRMYKDSIRHNTTQMRHESPVYAKSTSK